MSLFTDSLTYIDRRYSLFDGRPLAYTEGMLAVRGDGSRVVAIDVFETIPVTASGFDTRHVNAGYQYTVKGDADDVGPAPLGHSMRTGGSSCESPTTRF